MTQLEAMRGLMAANGDGGKKIWATEYGEPTSSVDDATPSGCTAPTGHPSRLSRLSPR